MTPPQTYTRWRTAVSGSSHADAAIRSEREKTEMSRR